MAFSKRDAIKLTWPATQPDAGGHAVLAKDFTRIYHVDLHGNVRQNPKLSGTTHNVFGIQVGVGVTVAIRRKNHKKHEIAYQRVEENLTRWDKYRWLEGSKQVAGVDWRKLKPDAKSTWLVAYGADEFEGFVPIADKRNANPQTIFAESSPGVKTNRDDVVYDFNRKALVDRVKQFIEDYNAEVDRYKRSSTTRRLKKTVDDYVKYDNIKWSETLKKKLRAGEYAKFDELLICTARYRPFTSSYLYFDGSLIERTYRFSTYYPAGQPRPTNTHIWVKSGRDWPVFGLASNQVVDLLPQGGSQCFPFYVYDEDGSNRRENVTDWALKTFREAYGDKTISKWDIFHYVYGMLHHPGYRDKFKDCLKRELPRIPFAGFENRSAAASAAQASGLRSNEQGEAQLRPEAHPAPKPAKRGAGKVPAPGAGDSAGRDASERDVRSANPALQFRAFADAGETLCKLHLDYEKLEPWPLRRMVALSAKGCDLYTITDKMRLSKDRKSLKVNNHLTLHGIPERCFDYRLGNRSALEWVIDQYRVKTDKKSGITSDPNRQDDPEYIVRLVGQVIRVSMETLDAIETLPESYGGPLP